ncbi:MAG: two-component hybrid sensor and regulator [Verrucomicrobiales bacterium]|nr:two-component hybrid sensor and regulator [Verrucomicrobiales bacterium]
MKTTDVLSRPALQKYAFAVLCSLFAFCIRYSLDPILGDKVPYLIFVPAALLASWYGGFGPASAVLILGLALANLFFITPGRTIWPEDFSELTQNAVYVLSTLGGIVLFEMLHRSRNRLHHLTEQLRETEERFRLMVKDAVDYAIFTIGPERHVSSWNPGAERMTGHAQAEVTGKVADFIFTPEDIAQHAPEQEIRSALEKGQAIDERWHVRKDGSRFWGSGRMVCLRDEAGTIKGYAKIMRDLTQKKKWEEELESRVRERTGELQNSNQEMEAMTYTIAHDLRAPLRAMKSFSEMLLKEHKVGLNAEGKDYLSRVHDSAERMSNLVDDLLEFGRLGRESLNLERVSLDQIFDGVLVRLSDDIQQKKASVEILHPLLPVKASRPVLEKVCCNLISNALKFVPEGVVPHIRVWTENGTSVRLFVEDNGIGIAREHQDRIFKVFERLHTKEKYSGTGVGLAIVQKGAQLMGGNVGVESAVGKGSLFSVVLQRP